MGKYVSFDRITWAIANGDDIEVGGKTLSFYDTDIVIKSFATIYNEIVDMFSNDRKRVIDKHEYRIARVIRTLTREVADLMGCHCGEKYGSPDRYTATVYDLLNLGIAPTAALFNIMTNTGRGAGLEHTISVGEQALLILAGENDNYYKTVNTEFFEEYAVIKNLICAEELNIALNLCLPTNMTDWLSGYEWSDADCKYVLNNFDDFTGLYEAGVCIND